jgi:hypothetical protein
MSLNRFLTGLLTAGLLAVPGVAQALEQRGVVMTTGIRISVVTALENITAYAGIRSVAVATVLFLVGATYLIGSAGKPEPMEKGKKLMKYSLQGMAVVLCSYMILRTVLYLLY